MKKLVQEYIMEDLSIFVVHFSVLSEKSRKKQFKELSEIIQKCPRPYLVCGDFNIFKGMVEVIPFIKENQLNWIKTDFTFPSFKPKRHLDLIMACESIHVKASGAIKSIFSDHLPIWIEID